MNKYQQIIAIFPLTLSIATNAWAKQIQFNPRSQNAAKCAQYLSRAKSVSVFIYNATVRKFFAFSNLDPLTAKPGDKFGAGLLRGELRKSKKSKVTIEYLSGRTHFSKLPTYRIESVRRITSRANASQNETVIEIEAIQAEGYVRLVLQIAVKGSGEIKNSNQMKLFYNKRERLGQFFFTANSD